MVTDCIGGEARGGCKLGAGAVVAAAVEDVEAGSTVGGVPAREIRG